MRHFFTLLILFTFVLGIQAQSIYNGDLELWTSKGNFQEPDTFSTSNALLAVVGVKNVFKESNSVYSDSFAAKLQNTYVTAIGRNVPGVLVYGGIDISQNYEPLFGPGKAFSARPNVVSAYLQYYPAKADTFGAFAVLTRWDTVNNKRDTIGIGGITGGDTIKSYTKMDMSINYLSPDNPDSILIVFSSSMRYNNTPSGSVLYVDEITTDAVSGISENKPSFELNIYPNPAKDFLYIDLEEAASGMSLELFNVLGMRVRSIPVTDAHMQIDVSQLHNGVYFYVLKKRDKNLRSGKLNIVR